MAQGAGAYQHELPEREVYAVTKDCFLRHDRVKLREIHECERFARAAGYRKVTLWTNSILHAARHVYENAGYRLVQSELHHSFGRDLVGETWEMDLADPTGS